MTRNEELPARVDRIEEKLDALAGSVDKRFAEVGKRFDEVSVAIAEQRQYTEFAFARLEKTMLGRFAAARQDVERLRVAALDQFEQLHRKVDRAATVDQLEALGQRLERAIATASRRRRRRPGPSKKR